MKVHRLPYTGPCAYLAHRYFDDERIMQVGPTAELLFVRALALASGLPTDGFIAKSLLRLCARDVRSLCRNSAALVQAGLWRYIDEDDGYQITNWLRYNPSDADVTAARELDQAMREWERNRKREQRKGREDIDRQGSVPPNVPRDMSQLFSPPPKGAGGENNKRARGALAPLRAGARARARDVGLDPTPPSSMSPQPGPPMDPERDWRAPRRTAENPPDLEVLRARLDEAARIYRNASSRKKPVIPPVNDGGGEDK